MQDSRLTRVQRPPILPTGRLGSLSFDPWAYAVKLPAPMFPCGLSADTRIPGRLVRAWLAAGGEQVQPLSALLGAILDKALPSRD